MGKKIFWYFLFFIFSITSAAVLYVQSTGFAELLRKELIAKVASEIGISLDFSRLKVDMLPPGISLVDVKVKILKQDNTLGLGINSLISAGQAGVSFRMVQALNRGITINKLFLNTADIFLEIPPGKKGQKKETENLSKLVTKPLKFKITEDLWVNIRQLEVRNTKISVREIGGEEQPIKLEIEKINYLSVSPESKGTGIIANFDKISFSQNKINESLDVLNLNADLMPLSIQIHALDLQRGQIASHVEGKLLGSIDKLESLKADARVISRAELKDLLILLKEPQDISGQVYSELQVSGDLSAPSIKGRARVDQLKYSLWELDRISTNLEYIPGNLVLSAILLERKQGSVGIKNIDLPLPLKSGQKNLELEFQKFSLHEFAGELNRSINNLDAVINGTAKLNIVLETNQKVIELKSLNLQPDFSIDNLWLTNQTYGVVRNKKEIIHVKNLKLNASIQYQDGVVNIEKGTLSLATGKIAVSGKVSKKDGYDIRGESEAIDLGKELEHIAEIPITGHGEMDIHVRGKPNNLFIDFDLDLDNAKYVNFDFGSILGKVTLDDHRSLIIISDLQAIKNESPYTLDGTVDIGDLGTLQLEANFRDTHPDDLFAIFSKQIEKIQWIPHGMTGLLQGNIKVGGSYDHWEKNLIVDAKLNAKKISYKGEIVNSVIANAGFNQGVYYARDIAVEKYSSLGSGSIYYYPDDRLKYNFEITRGKVRDLNYVSNLELPFDSTVTGVGSGEGKWETLKSHMQLNFENAFVRTQPVPAMKFIFDTSENYFKYVLKNNETTTLFQMQLAKTEKDKSNLAIDLTNNNFSYLLCVLNKRLCADPRLQFISNIKMSSEWQGKKWEKMSGAGEVADLLLQKSDFRLKNLKPTKFQIANGSFVIPKIEFMGEETNLTVESTGRVDGKDLRIATDGHVPLRIVEFLTSLIEESKGTLDLKASLYGDLDKIQLSGGATIQNGFLRFSGLDAAAENLIGKIRFFNNRAQVDAISGSMGGGSLNVTGFVDLFLNKAPIFNLEMALRDNRAKFTG